MRAPEQLELSGDCQESLESPGSSRKDSVAQVAFSSVLQLKGKGFERDSQIQQINRGVQDWCYRRSYLDSRTCFEEPGLMGTDGVHLSDKGKNISGDRLANLGKRVLN